MDIESGRVAESEFFNRLLGLERKRSERAEGSPPDDSERAA